MKNSFWGLIWQSFLDIQGIPLSVFGIFISILLSRFPVTTSISLDLVIVIGLVFILLILTLIKALDTIVREYQRIENDIIPKIQVVKQDPTTKSPICLLEFSEIFGVNLSISFYYTDEDGFEILIGEGFIKNIQRDGKIQAVLDKPQQDYQEVIDKLANNDQKILEKTVVKPGVTRPKNRVEEES